MTADRPGEPADTFEGSPSETHPETAATADAAAGHHGRSKGRTRAGADTPAIDPEMPPILCRDCPLWYGEEDRGWGPCSIKHQRGDVRFITFGGHTCDEGYQPPVGLRDGKGKAAGLSGVRSTSRASAVGYSSTSKQGKGRVRASRRRSAGSTSTRRRASSTK